MNDKEHPIPTEINLHRKSRLLTIAFADGNRFELPCEYLRVNSPAAEVKAMGQPVVGKEEVNIESIEPQGHYAVRLVFDDGHDTGIYAWETLHELGLNYETNWNRYLEQLKAIGHERETALVAGDQPLELKVLYFSYLVQKLRKESEQVRVPPKVADIKGLLEWLRRKWLERGYLLADDRVRVTVNRQFAEPFTRLEDGDEIGITPNSPNPPPPPN
ncbi:MAG: hypothetical protein A2286_02935 [Gammaproteobacteria bacterium RIFOXYA12_FULL_61_12]|nr:MAG: hypothetical protein A2514_00780 [Gammaproteobacteria bacterium RIFOXYD12_FULL_61_37]OGT93845.1 MAG: hypothetical protein A2286_02935 [Gammaproteobacteria bacterium RIFOXYA12_FULL_61_12]